MSDELPEGWAEATGADLFRWSSGKFLPKSRMAAGGVPVYGGNGVSGAHSGAIVQHETLVVGRVGAQCGNVHRTGGPAWVTDNAIYAAWVSDAVALPFAYHAFRTSDLNANAGGSGQPFVNQDALNSVAVSLPPLPEQHRIVDAVEALLEQVNRARERLDRVPLILKRFRQAVLAAACSGRLTEDWREGAQAPAWQSVTVEGVCWSVTDGDHQAPPKAASGIPFITISAINDGELRLNKATRHVPASYFASLKPERRPAPGDVLFSVTGSIGISALVERSEPFVFQRHIAILKPNADRILSKFLRYRMEAHDIKVQGEEIATGTAQLTIPLGGLRNFTFELPSLVEQAEIVRHIENLFALADTIERRVRAATSRADKLPQAILSKAFSGELVPTEADLARAEGRTYETAAELLARIAKERESGEEAGGARAAGKNGRSSKRRAG